jgi:hypothetical protein
MFHGYRRAKRGIIPVESRHFLRHANAAVAIGNTWEKPLMHTDSSRDSHEVRHGCAAKGCPGWAGVLLNVYVLDDDASGAIDVIPIEVGGVREVLLHDLESPRRRIEAFSSAGDRRHANQFAPLVKGGCLLREIDDNGRRTRDATVVPVGFLKGEAFLYRRIDDRSTSAEVNGISIIEPRVVTSAGSQGEGSDNGSDDVTKRVRISHAP